jgi:hypothetical protein
MGGALLFLCAPVFSAGEPLENADAKAALTKASPKEPMRDYKLTKRILTAKSNKPGRVGQLIAGYKNADGKGFTLSALYHENAKTLKDDWDKQHEGLKKRSPEIKMVKVGEHHVLSIKGKSIFWTDGKNMSLCLFSYKNEVPEELLKAFLEMTPSSLE